MLWTPEDSRSAAVYVNTRKERSVSSLFDPQKGWNGIAQTSVFPNLGSH